MNHALLRSKLVPCFAAFLALSGQLAADTVFNFIRNDGSSGLFQEENGTVTDINTGLNSNDAPSLSRDGRFILISAADPAQPNEASDDLFSFDRATNTRRRVIDNSTQPLQDGGFSFRTPTFSGLSPNGLVIALHTVQSSTNPQQQNGSTSFLEIFRTSDGAPLYLVEIGTGQQTNLLSSEFIGISWRPEGGFFATSAEIPIAMPGGNTSSAPGIVLFGFHAEQNRWQRVRNLSQPFAQNFAVHYQILPSFSPNGERLAYFNIFNPDPNLTQPVTASLIVANRDGSNPVNLFTFTSGFYPLGVTWSTDGSQLVFSIAQQRNINNGGVTFYSATGEPSTAVIRTINSTTGGQPTQLPGINGGFFPSIPYAPRAGGGDLSQVDLSVTQQSGGESILRVTGLNPGTTYTLEGSPDLVAFDSSQQFTGQRLMDGISIPKNVTRRFFRIRFP